MPNDLKMGIGKSNGVENPYPLACEPGYQPTETDVKNATTLPETAKPLDLHYFINQVFTQDIKAIKRWVCTAFVAEQDRKLIEIQADLSQNKQNSITEKIIAIDAILQKPADLNLDLNHLEILMKDLFTTKHWLPVALRQVDLQQLDIDTLNSLIQWQGFFKQFSEFNLHMNSAEQPLTAVTLGDTKYLCASMGETVLDLLFACVSINSTHQFSNMSICHFTHEMSGHIIYQVPSTKLYEQILRDKKIYILPLYAMGYLVYEHFVALALLGGRLMHAYLPESKHTRAFVHGAYFGPALPIEHDYVHIDVDGNHMVAFELDEVGTKKFMAIAAIVANMFARCGDARQANYAIDTISNMGYTLVTNDPIKLIKNLYQELAYFVGFDKVKISVGYQVKEIYSYSYKVTMEIGDKQQEFVGTLYTAVSEKASYVKQTVATLHEHIEVLKQIKKSCAPSTLQAYHESILPAVEPKKPSAFIPPENKSCLIL